MRGNCVAYLSCSTRSLITTLNIMVYPEAQPHDPPLQVADDLFVVYGSIKLQPGVRMTRNMTIVRHDGELTLISPVRLDQAGLAQLDALGTVRHVIRLGPMHGLDDPFYLDRYDAAFWAVPGMELSRGEGITNPLVGGESGPCTNSSVFTFQTTTKPEAILRLGRHGGTLVTCDSLQNFLGPDAFFNDAATERMQAGGFLRPANVGPGWRQATDPKPEDFTRLKQLEFRHVLSGHGEPCLNEARTRYSDTFQDIFGV